MTTDMNETIMLHMMPAMSILFACIGILATFRSIQYYRRLKELLRTSSAASEMHPSAAPGFGAVISAAFSNKLDADTRILMARAGLTRWLTYAVTSPPAAMILWFVSQPMLVRSLNK